MKQLSSYSAHSNSSRTHALPSSTHSYNARIALYAAFLFLGVLCCANAWGALTIYDFSSDCLTELGIDAPSSGSGTTLNPASTYTLTPINMQVTHGGNTNTRIYNSSGTYDLRMYDGESKHSTLTISSSYTITQIHLEGGSSLTASAGTFSSGIWTGSATSVTFTSTANTTIKSIAVVYTPSGFTNTFKRITSIGELENGDEIIFVNQDEIFACGTTQNTNNRTPVSITTSSNSYNYSALDNVQVFIVRTDGKNYGFHAGTGYIYSASGSANNLKTNSTLLGVVPSGTSAWTYNDISVSYAFDLKNATNSSYHLAFNGTSYFSQYTDQTTPLIYKRQIGLPDHFIDIMHGNEVADIYGTYSAPKLDNTVEGSYEEAAHYIFIGWVAAGDYSTADGSITGTIIAPGTEMTGNNTTYYAVWGKDVE